LGLYLLTFVTANNKLKTGPRDDKQLRKNICQHSVKLVVAEQNFAVQNAYRIY
jgi:hypothetical protein